MNAQLAQLRERFPLVPHTDAGRLFSTVRRMRAEKDLRIPIRLRTGFALSARTGKPANEMTETEWEAFLQALTSDLRTKYPELYQRHFSDWSAGGVAARSRRPLKGHSHV